MISEFERAHAALINEIIAANQDFAERAANATLRVIFDSDEDLFIFELGGPQASMTESVHNTIFLRVDPNTLKLNGIEFYNCRKLAETEPTFRDFVGAAVVLTALKKGVIEGLPTAHAQPSILPTDLTGSIDVRLSELPHLSATKLSNEVATDLRELVCA